MSAHTGMARRHMLGLAVAVGGLAMSGGVRSVLAQALQQTPGPSLGPQTPPAPRPIAPRHYGSETRH
jgi:hypothetical protein